MGCCCCQQARRLNFKEYPGFDKGTIPNLVALVGCLVTLKRPSRIWSGFGFAGLFIFSYLIGPFITAELNTDPVVLANKTLPAETHYDALSAVVAQFLALIPFFVGRRVLKSSRDNEEIFCVLVIAGLIYSLPMLLEVRISPQLHYWFYGYYPSDFNQYMRDGDSARWYF